MILRGARAVERKPKQLRRFDLGIVTSEPPTEPRIMGRAALMARNVDLDNKTIRWRQGMVRVAENSPGAVQISNFEPAETWTATGIASVSAATIGFVTQEAGGVGTQGRKAEFAMVGPGTVTAGMKRTGLALDLSGPSEDVFVLWIYGHSVPAPTHLDTYTVSLIFRTSVGNYFTAVVSSSAGNDLAPSSGFYARPKRLHFIPTGAPNWANITEIEISISLTDPEAHGTGIGVAFDNLYKAPGRGQALISFRRNTDPTYKGIQDIYAILDGRIYRLNKPTERWIDMGLYFDPTAQVTWAIMNDRLYLGDGINPNRKIMPDGVTIYLMGIEKIGAPITATPSAVGGFLQTGDHRVVFTYYSTTTGVESAPNIREGQIVTVVGPTGQITYTGIPASPDPQVTHVRIYRLSSTSTVFRRVSQLDPGEILNGVTTYVDTLADSQMGDELDPDLDAPRPLRLMAAWPGVGVIVGVFGDTPTAINFSSLAEDAGPENWPVENIIAAGRDDSESFTAVNYDGVRMVVHRNHNPVVAYRVNGPEQISGRALDCVGAAGPDGILTVENRTYYPALDGIYAMDRDESVHKVMTLAQPTWNDTVDAAGLRRACAVLNLNRFQYRLYFQSKGYVQNNLCWNLHYVSVIPDSRFDKNIGSGNVGASTLDDQAAMAASPVLVEPGNEVQWILGTDGQVYLIDAGFADDGRPIESIWQTTELSPDQGQLIHRFSAVDLELDQSSDDLVTLNVRYDFSMKSPESVASGMMVSDDATPFGTGLYGEMRYGQARGHYRYFKIGPRRARYIMLEVRKKGRAPGNIRAINLWSAPVARIP